LYFEHIHYVIYQRSVLSPWRLYRTF